MMTFEQAKACVLYEDNHLLVVCKPVNMPVQADASGDEDLLTAMKAYVKQAYNKPGEVIWGLCIVWIALSAAQWSLPAPPRQRSG